MLPSFVQPEIIPHKPGIYIYKDKAGKIIYVGKAVDLFSRVSSYFTSSWKDVKTARLVGDIASAETIIVESEIEALILEANLIKKNKPHYNIRLTDDKDYLYIVVTDEEFPKVLTARKKDLLKGKKWFGPYPSATTVKTTLKKLRRIFPWCSGKNQGAGIMNHAKRKVCFYYHLGLCPGACAGVVSQKDYIKIINRFSKFLDGKKHELLEELNSEMKQYSRKLRFEEASRVKKIIDGINYITAPTKISNYLVNPNFLEDLNKNSLEELQRDLNLPELPVRIEAYDISNFQGKEATGSMVVLTGGEIDKSQYRRFKIRMTGKPNDVGMHKEMMGRRLNHEDWPLPHLFIIDGGRGQAYAIAQLVNLKGVNIPVFGLAKREEWLYPPEGEVIKLPKRSLALRLLQKIRDESHRFAISYHKKLRAKVFLK
ncbi:excinuclease ABC subunit UvrC [Candidatus Daviesbacteria bacterium]|nr:excinuclease ABC subunit UvrC [Candidatus Daviesbacteria bacterium]